MATTASVAALPAQQRCRAVALRGQGMHRLAAILEACAADLEQALHEEVAARGRATTLFPTPTHTRSTR